MTSKEKLQEIVIKLLCKYHNCSDGGGNQYPECEESLNSKYCPIKVMGFGLMIQVLLDALPDLVKIDKKKLEDTIFNYSETNPQYPGWQSGRLADKIFQTKGIIKVKEE